jgi:hypothetical protein
MNGPQSRELDFDEESDEKDVGEQLMPGSVAAVVSGTDWTTETVVSQLKRGNIQLNPRFQRRDAWKRDRKSRFIESLIVGLPIPQIVLAESKAERGKFIVLDGKQRLLSILQFWGLGEGEHNAFSLTGLTLRDDLRKKTFEALSTDANFEADFNALCNQAIRTVVIRNWKDTNFLHTVFLRLNTGSVTLSPQELRQALLPGEFSDFVDDAASESQGLRTLLGTSGPDPRMRDIEILSRFLAFRFFASTYPGRMKAFLDETFKTFNDGWKKVRSEVEAATDDFEEGVAALLEVFDGDLAKKPNSVQFNRAVFDALIYFHSQERVRTALRSKKRELKRVYATLFSEDSDFLKAVESDTAGAPNTSNRLRLWGESISAIAGKTFAIPKIPLPTGDGPKKKLKK